MDIFMNVLSPSSVALILKFTAKSFKYKKRGIQIIFFLIFNNLQWCFPVLQKFFKMFRQGIPNYE